MFPTANPGAAEEEKGHVNLSMLPNERMNPLFETTIQATEEAIVNAMVAAQIRVGADNHKVVGLPHDHRRVVLKKYNRPAR